MTSWPDGDGLEIMTSNRKFNSLIDAYEYIHVKNNPAKFHSDGMWNDWALNFFEEEQQDE